MSKKPVRLFNCIAMTADRLRTLQALARCPGGSAASPPVLEGAHLATLVAMGLAERLPRAANARLGGSIYQCTPAGLELAAVADASGARTGASE
jgi:hypothetical protein